MKNQEGKKPAKIQIGTHSALPWKMEYQRWPDHQYADSRQVNFRAADGNLVSFTMQGRVDDLRGNADAELIERAVNSHEALVEALREVDQTRYCDGERITISADTARKVRAALKLAQEVK